MQKAEGQKHFFANKIVKPADFNSFNDPNHPDNYRYILLYFINLHVMPQLYRLLLRFINTYHDI